MRKVLILAAGLAMLGTSAMGQSMSRDRDDDYSRGRWNDNRDRWDRSRDDMRGWSMRDDDESDRPGGNARFFVRSGDTQLRIICGDRESTQACIDSALRVFERVQSQSRATTGSSAPASSPAPSNQ